MKQKVAALALVIVLLVLALLQISDVVHDRQSYRQIAIQSIAQSLAGPQTLTGPLIHRACTEEWDVKYEARKCAPSGANSRAGGCAGLAHRQGRQQAGGARPRPACDAGLQPEGRHRGRMGRTESLKPVAEHAGSRMNCGQPLLMMAVSDSRGIRHASVKIGEQLLALKPGTFYGSYPRGVHAPLSIAMVQARRRCRRS
jgi:inner membrane protein